MAVQTCINDDNYVQVLRPLSLPEKLYGGL